MFASFHINIAAPTKRKLINPSVGNVIQNITHFVYKSERICGYKSDKVLVVKETVTARNHLRHVVLVRFYFSHL